jgi:type IV secretion system protein TrbI
MGALMSTDKNKTDPFALESGVPDIAGALRPTPKFSDRISVRVLGVVFALVVVVVGIFFAALDGMDKKSPPRPPPDKSMGSPAAEKDHTVPTELKGEDGRSETDAVTGKPSGTPASLTAKLASPQPLTSLTLPLKPGGQAAVTLDNGVPASKEIPAPAAPPVVPPLTPEQQAVAAEKIARQSREKQVRDNGMLGKTFNAEGGAKTAADLLASAKGASGFSGPPPAQGPSGDPKTETEQDEKLEFVKNASKDDRSYHPNVALPALSANEIKTGSFIPMTLAQSMNSDLPGQVTARVSEDVYDTITGCRLLIPAMSKAVGKYDSKVALGQGRALVVWSSLIFPNGDELNLGGMQGYDTSGQSGMEADVDNHYWRLFGVTLGLSLLTAGAQLSVPQPNPGTNGAVAPQTPTQTVAAALSQQYGALGAQILGKYIAVQPTLRNYVGERFLITVPHTVVFKKVWRQRCTP